MSHAPRFALSHWLRQIERLDRELTLRLMRQVASHPGRRVAGTLLAHSGDGIIWVFVGVGALALAPREARTDLLEVAAGVLLAAVWVAAIKHAARRERPDPLLGARWSALPKHDRYSFPSGHAARAVCLAVCLAPRGSLLTLVWTLWALGVCLARVAVGAHYALDVVSGACLGGLAALAVHRTWPFLESVLRGKLF